MNGAGNYDEVIEIWQTYITKNEYNEQVNEFNYKNRTKAKVRYDSGDRLIENNEIFYSYIRTFEVRDYVDIYEFNRIKYKKQFYRILNIQHIKRERKIIIQCELIND